MPILDPLKEKAGSFYLRKSKRSLEQTSGSNFQVANNVLLLYVCRDEQHYKEVKQIARSIQEDFGVKRVYRFAYWEGPAKQAPQFLTNRLDSTFITKDDLNWHMKPVKNITDLMEHRFDIQINLEQKPCTALSYIMREANSGMSVGCNAINDNEALDFVLELAPDSTLKAFWSQVHLYLGNNVIR